MQTETELSRRQRLYEKNYVLLKEFVPELMDNNRPDFWLKPSKMGKFDAQAIRQYDENIFEIGNIGITFYDIDTTDITLYPHFKVTFDNMLKTARVINFKIGTPVFYVAGISIFEEFDYTADSEEDGETEYAVNEYLNSWLYTFAEYRRKDPDYFEKIPMWNN